MASGTGCALSPSHTPRTLARSLELGTQDMLRGPSGQPAPHPPSHRGAAAGLPGGHPPWGNRSRAEPAHGEPRVACEPAGSSARARLLWESVTAPFGATHMPRASVAWVWDGCLSGREEAHTWESGDQEEQGLASGHAPNASFCKGAWSFVLTSPLPAGPCPRLPQHTPSSSSPG